MVRENQASELLVTDLIYTRSAVMEGVRGFIHLFWLLLQGGFNVRKGIPRIDSLDREATI